jgi:hypothetical protein
LDDNDSPLHGNSGCEDVIDPFPEIIQVLLTVNEKRKDSHFINLARVPGLGDRGRRDDENKGKKKT